MLSEAPPEFSIATATTPSSCRIQGGATTSAARWNREKDVVFINTERVIEYLQELCDELQYENMNKELPELFAMLKSAEIEIKKEHRVLMVNKTTNFKKQGKSKGKFKKGGKKAATPPMKPKTGPKPDLSAIAKEKGHWKRNCSKYLADLKSGLVKKKKEDPLTKALPRAKHDQHQNDMGVRNFFVLYATNPYTSVGSVGSKTVSASAPKLSDPILNFGGGGGSSTGGLSGPFNFAPYVTIRLNGGNYLYWRAHVLNVLRSHLLTGFVDGTFPCPAESIANPALATDDKAPPLMYNPAFTAWHQQDAALLSAIMTTSTEDIEGIILFATSSADAWSTLEASFTS
ncbi:hypothetical protein QYE76_002068 [Lolium multiflorum]|uniref:Retrotransposon Copia-like N-terminal domain-containing protein n=1 Tax=Lolium multiflorum TaxID=4521 RepID=A0AAD8VZY0_LOLMU|nr:hypothetical protein QYE76_002068 [Lolium multiflorum]